MVSKNYDAAREAAELVYPNEEQARAQVYATLAVVDALHEVVGAINDLQAEVHANGRDANIERNRGFLPPVTE